MKAHSPSNGYAAVAGSTEDAAAKPRHPASQIALLASCLSFLLIGLGCNAEQPDLTLTSLKNKTAYDQQFSKAYAGRGADGNMDVVLVDRAAEKALSGENASGGAPVRQVMHIRVLWMPTRELKADHAAACNAAVHWYVLGNCKGLEQDLIEYSGTALVSLDESGSRTEVTIRNATLEPKVNHGGLVDPVGRSRLEGTIVARNDSGRVNEVLNSVRTIVAAAHPPRNSEPEGPSSSAR